MSDKTIFAFTEQNETPAYINASLVNGSIRITVRSRGSGGVTSTDLATIEMSILQFGQLVLDMNAALDAD